MRTSPMSPAVLVRPQRDVLQRLISFGADERATDVHLEPQGGNTALRIRVDGLMTESAALDWPRSLHEQTVARIKVLAGLDVAERRRPQDGRFLARVASGSVDVRVSTLPTPHGESVDLRILSRSYVEQGLSGLGLDDEQVPLLHGLLEKPVGVVLVTGPTGSGKTTTLYTCLQRLKHLGRKIISVEDPIEYETAGVTQVQVRPEIGLTFASVLRAMLRHDPDVMMVGEMRDAETAATTVQVALTGHLVLSTLHTHDAATAPARLVDMGVEPYLVASCLECVVAQRLVRVVCDGCRREASVEQAGGGSELARQIAMLVPGWNGQVAVGDGCERCRGTGYFGRTGIYEILQMNEDLREATVAKVPVGELRARALASGLRTLRQDGLAKVGRGITTLAELNRVTGADVAR